MNIDQKAVFQKIYRRLRNEGKICAPRGLKIIECENFSYELPPRVCFTNFADRKLSLPYTKTEFLWYLRGDLYDLSIAKHAAIWRGIVVKGRLNSNYGHYIWRANTGLTYSLAGGQSTINRPELPRGMFAWVIDELRRDKDSRRAYMMILGNEHLNPEEKDVPCTLAIGFRIREDRLNMSVRMRSQDAIYGMGSDAPAFSFIHQMLHAALLGTHPNLQLGTYHHVADSFHVYERHFNMLDKITLPDAGFTTIEYPEISSGAEVDYLISPDFQKDVEHPQEFQFTRWLTTDLPQD